MRNSVSLFINGRLHEVRGRDAFRSLAEYLRSRCSLTGTKVVCSEGDCGSCTVLCGRLRDDRFVYLPIDSCIQYLFQLDGTHIVTVEGLSRDGELTPVQEAMVDCHGSQCGFCTPGFVVAMTALAEARQDEAIDWRGGLTGNLCRCTGYVPILEAGQQAATQPHLPLNKLYPVAEMKATAAQLASESFEVIDDTHDPTRHAISPLTLSQAVAERSRFPGAVLVAGATDVGVQLNKRKIAPRAFIDLNRIPDLDAIEIRTTKDGKRVMHVGARTTWSQLADAFESTVPEFHEIISVFGGPQIRHVGTLAGNLANASPIADSIPFLMVMGAQLELLGPRGSRLVELSHFYRGYKQLDMRSDELISEVRIPLPQADEQLHLTKVSRRRDLDISTITAAMRLSMTGDTISSVRIALGGVGPVVIRATQTELFLKGQPITTETMQTAGDIATTEISPITDVRGTASYRYQLVRNLFHALHHKQMTPTN